MKNFFDFIQIIAIAKLQGCGQQGSKSSFTKIILDDSNITLNKVIPLEIELVEV